MIPGSSIPILMGKSEYKISNSLRFRAANSAYLSRTSGASPTDKKKATLSTWIKAAPSISTSTQVCILTSTGNACAIGWNIASYSGDFFVRVDGPGNDIRFPIKFRDPSAWGHLQIAVDTTDATASDRVKVYWNGVRLTPNASTYPTLNSDTTMNPASTAFRFMSDVTNGAYIDGYAGEVNFIDGQALTPSSFGQTDNATGVWVPKKYSGTYGTNGFYLKFADASAATATAIGKDSSGNGNNWTPSGISVTSGTTFDQMTDTPTLNYCTGNPLSRYTTNTYNFTNANLEVEIFDASNIQIQTRMSMGVFSGKWYWEATLVSYSIYRPSLGVAADNILNGYYVGGTALQWGVYGTTGEKYNNGVFTAYGSAAAINDVVQIALDMDNGKIWWGKNGTWFASGDPASGTNAAFTNLAGNTVFPAMGAGGTTNAGGKYAFNFGQRPFAYTQPTGFKALNTANLPTPSIKKGSLYMDATTRTGTGATASVSSLAFQPDLVWIKSRLSQTNHNLFDSVRTATNGLILNATTAEFTDSNTLTAFNSNGYSLGSDASSRGVNVNAASYVDWAWKEAASSGFDIVSYAGDNTSNRNISHSLGVAPKFAIVKSEGTSNVWMWHANLTGNTSYIILNGLAVQTTTNTPWGTGNWSSTQFMVTNNATENANAASTNYIAYLWSEVDGFSKFGYYDGNASTDGPFVWCGFRPRFVFMRYATGTNAGAFLRDSVRDPVNTAVKSLAVGYTIASAETDFAANELDLLSNGFKLRSASGGAGTGYTNYASTSYVFAAFAETPFKYASAR